MVHMYMRNAVDLVRRHRIQEKGSLFSFIGDDQNEARDLLVFILRRMVVERQLKSDSQLNSLEKSGGKGVLLQGAEQDDIQYGMLLTDEYDQWAK